MLAISLSLVACDSQRKLDRLRKEKLEEARSARRTEQQRAWHASYPEVGWAVEHVKKMKPGDWQVWEDFSPTPGQRYDGLLHKMRLMTKAPSRSGKSGEYYHPAHVLDVWYDDDGKVTKVHTRRLPY